MQVRTQVHEAVLDQIRPGLPVTIRVDAFPNKTFRGQVSEVAVVPSDNSNTNAKTYDCVVIIPELVSQLKPGMTAVTEIHVDRLENVVSVPVQAIVQEEDSSWLYIRQKSSDVKRVDVELGRNNDQFVHVKTGIEAGTKVVLNPMAIHKTEQNTREISPNSGAADAPEFAVDPSGIAETSFSPTATDGQERSPGQGAERRRMGNQDGGERTRGEGRPRGNRRGNREPGGQRGGPGGTSE